MSEKTLLDRIILALSPKGARIFRNNCGVAFHKDGSVVRYGIANPGGSDLIGWTPVVITPDMVGKTVSIFTAIEVKTGKVRTTREQARFVAAVNQAGGIALVARSVEEAIDGTDGRIQGLCSPQPEG